jgi:hypothetical protein
MRKTFPVRVMKIPCFEFREFGLARGGFARFFAIKICSRQPQFGILPANSRETGKSDLETGSVMTAHTTTPEAVAEAVLTFLRRSLGAPFGNVEPVTACEPDVASLRDAEMAMPPIREMCRLKPSGPALRLRVRNLTGCFRP